MMKSPAILLILVLSFFTAKATAQCSLTGSDNQAVCINVSITNIEYTLAAATSGTVSGLPGGVSYVFATPKITISGTPNVAGTFNYTVNMTDGTSPCTSNGTITVTALPAAAGSISGSANVCKGQTGVAYNVGAITGATSYAWNYTGSGATISGGTTNSITIDFNGSATSGDLTVYGINSCGNGTTSATFPISVNSVPSASGSISGPATVCQGQSGAAYNVGSITGATSYVWAYSGTGATINGTGNSVTVDFASNATAGNLTVYGTNT